MNLSIFEQALVKFRLLKLMTLKSVISEAIDYFRLHYFVVVSRLVAKKAAAPAGRARNAAAAAAVKQSIPITIS